MTPPKKKAPAKTKDHEQEPPEEQTPNDAPDEQEPPEEFQPFKARVLDRWDVKNGESRTVTNKDGYENESTRYRVHIARMGTGLRFHLTPNEAQELATALQGAVDGIPLAGRDE